MSNWKNTNFTFTIQYSNLQNKTIFLLWVSTVISKLLFENLLSLLPHDSNLKYYLKSSFIWKLSCFKIWENKRHRQPPLFTVGTYQSYIFNFVNDYLF